MKSDDLGSWRNNGVDKEKFGMDDEGSILSLDDHDMPPPDWVIYYLRRTYYKNRRQIRKRIFSNFKVGIT